MGTGFKSKPTASRARGPEGNKQPFPGNALYTQGRKASAHSEGLNHLQHLSFTASAPCSGPHQWGSPTHSRQFFLETSLPLHNFHFSFSLRLTPTVRPPQTSRLQSFHLCICDPRLSPPMGWSQAHLLLKGAVCSALATVLPVSLDNGKCITLPLSCLLF